MNSELDVEDKERTGKTKGYENGDLENSWNKIRFKCKKKMHSHSEGVSHRFELKWFKINDYELCKI